MTSDLKMIFGNYQAKSLDEHTWIIEFMNGSQYLYLLEGEEKALLIDTGYGAGNLKAFVKKLTSKELLVVNTHYHPDHAGGNGEFESVFLSSGFKLDANAVDLPGGTPFDLSKLPYPNYMKIVIGNGDVFDLGGREIEVIEARPAHCNSSLFFFDRTNNIFFVGDEFEAGQVLLFDNSKNPKAPYNVQTRLDNMAKNASLILKLTNEETMICPNHNGTPIERAYIMEFAELVEKVYSAEAVIEDKLNHPFIEMDPQAPFLCRVSWKRASIFIVKELLMEVYGKGKSE